MQPLFPVAIMNAQGSALVGVFNDFYNFDEASNTADAHDYVGSQDLVHSGSVVRAAAFGNIPFCKTFNNSTPNYYNVAGPSIFSMGDIDYSFCGWFYRDEVDFSGGNERIFGKGTSKTEYVLTTNQNAGNDVISWSVYAADGTTSQVLTTPNGPSLGQQWIWFAVNHKASNNTMSLRVECPGAPFSYDSGAVATTVTPGLVFDEDFIVGIAGNYSSFALKGYQTSFGMKKTTALTTAQEDLHYNSAAGVTAPLFTP